MKILVTGAFGFIGKNLVLGLKNRGYSEIYEYGRDTGLSNLDDFCRDADFVFHLAGINRPKDVSGFMDGNLGFTSTLIDRLKFHRNFCPVMMSSSTQAQLVNPYGASKKASEDLLLKYADETGAKILIYRLSNVYGKWCKPNYNSVVATFCHNIARDLPITVSDPGKKLNLIYIDDLVGELIGLLGEREDYHERYRSVPEMSSVTLEEIVQLLRHFKASREELSVPDMSCSFVKKLYSTYLSYLPEDRFSYDLVMHKDDRGSFSEFIRTTNRGQVSINVLKSGVTKGNHWHHTKNEKFLVISGRGTVRFRRVDSDEVIEYHVADNKMEVVDIPVGYTHHIENVGETDLVIVIWANETFDPENPDTYYAEV